MRLEDFRRMTQSLPNDTEIIVNFDDTHLDETVEFAEDDLQDIVFVFEDEDGNLVKGIKLVTCYSKFAK